MTTHNTNINTATKSTNKSTAKTHSTAKANGSASPEIPDAEARVIVVHERRQDIYLLQVDKCPLCSKTHTHGAGTDPEQVHTYLGHRGAHCFNDDTPNRDRGYNLILSPEAK
ncbi:MAG: hypothetical protein ACYC1M_04065 [Armatimonadota bacterium]